MSPRALLSVLMLVVPLCAQDRAWRLPERGAAEYRRTGDAKYATADSLAAAQKADAKDEVPTGLLPHLVQASWLCQGELAADQLSVGDEPRDLRDLVRAVAFDLRLGGAAKLRFHRLVPFGDLLLTGKVAAMAADGTQTIDLDVAAADPEVLAGESKAALGKFVKPLCKFAPKGTLHVTRTFDAQAGVVRTFAGELTLVWEEAKKACHKLVVREQWDFVAAHEGQDAAFRGDVADAIRNGAKWLKRELGDLSRRHFQDQGGEDYTYGSGRIALVLLTLLHAEVPPNDPVIEAGFAELAKRELTDTYSLGVALMALAERYAPRDETERLRSGALAAPEPRTLSETDRALAADWLARLRKNVDTRVDPGYVLRFNYVAGPRFDNSVNQYGLLGLYAASLCGLEVSGSAWRAAAGHLVDVQTADNGRELKLDLTSYRDLAAAGAGGKATRAAGGKVAARGYAYHAPERPAYGSMTAAGVGGLVIARAGLVATNLAKADIVPKVDAAIASGFAWFAAEFHVRSNPGFVERADDNWYYYLYSLERTCELASVALIQGRDWYYEGAIQLLAQQNKNGAFRPEHPRGFLMDATCFAVLFLKKAALPAVTGG